MTSTYILRGKGQDEDGERVVRRQCRGEGERQGTQVAVGTGTVLRLGGFWSVSRRVGEFVLLWFCY